MIGQQIEQISIESVASYLLNPLNLLSNLTLIRLICCPISH